MTHPADAAGLLERLVTPNWDARPAPRTAIIAAHPDDETVGAGARLRRFRKALFIHVTDGAPRDLRDARTAGFATREAYAEARTEELLLALAHAGIPPERSVRLGLVDQEASLQLAPLTRALYDLLRDHAPEVVLTHPYEGGHPDHDATAFAVHGACRLLEERSGSAPLIAEMTSYHNRGGEMACYEFLPGDGREVVTRILAPEEQMFKRKVLACYMSQTPMLRQFPVELERFRLAPPYDFTQPPHEGVLFYEMYEWGMTGERWLSLARDAIEELESPGAGLEVERG